MKVKSSADLARLTSPKSESAQAHAPISELAESIRKASETNGKTLDALMIALGAISSQLKERGAAEAKPQTVEQQAAPAPPAPPKPLPQKWAFSYERDRNGFLLSVTAKSMDGSQQWIFRFERDRNGLLVNMLAEPRNS